MIVLWQTLNRGVVWRRFLMRDQDTNVRTSGRRLEDVRKMLKGAM